ncbi:MAG: PepSY-like domain-containing protein [Bacteroidales bacterium]|nr:PepSY-like domain-containing protein [Bacteroidales bacterium]
MKTKSLFIVVLLVLTTVFTAKADNDRPISFDSLPQPSKDFITKYFNKSDISYAKIDDDFFSKSYEVFFVNGSKVEFNKDGEWKEIDNRKNPIPEGIVPAQIVDYVNKNHSAFQIVKIDRDRKDYEIELNNGLEIKFDLNFNVIGYDD